MAFKPLTVNTPIGEEAHILAEDDAALYDGIFGEDCVLKLGEQFASKTISNNVIRIMDGVVVVGGHVGRIIKGDYEDMMIDNGTADQKRNDLIVARFQSGGTGGADTYSLVVVKGTPGSTAKDPAIVQEDLYAGGKQRDYPLYRVRIENLSVVGVDKLFGVQHRFSDLIDVIYPVGSIYMSANNVNPKKLFGGQWEVFGQGKTLIGKAADGTFGTLGATGGATSKNIQVNAHTHAISHTHTIASHSHTIAHTHTVNAHSHSISHTHGMSHNHTVGNTVLSATQLTKHTHGFNGTNGHRDAFGVTSAGNGGGTYSGYVSIAYNGEGSVANEATGGSGSHTHTLGTVGLTTGGSSAANSGNSSPATGGSSAANSGGSGTLTSGNASASSSGSGGAQTISVDVTQPYIVVNMWKRIA